MKHSRILSLTIMLALSLLLLGGALPAFAQEGSPAAPAEGQPQADAAAAPDSPDAAQAALGTAFTYQGSLKKSGQPVNTTCSFQFSLWDALTSGSQKGATQTVNSVAVQAGVFTVQLDFGNQFTGDARWLQTAVQCAGDGGFSTLNPRQPLNAVPYALSLRPGAQVVGASNTTDGIVRATNSGAGAALVGMATSATGATYGVLGNAFSPNGFAVWGYANGGATGVAGASAANGPGVSGTSATGWGVYGEGGGAGVVGVTATRYNPAVYGEHRGAADGVGVKGKAVNGTGVAGESTKWYGTYGKSAQQSGVYGETAVAHSNGPAGVYGKSTGDGGIGVTGEATLGNSWGVYGIGAAGAGVMGKATSGVALRGESATGPGVYGQTGAAGSPALWGKNTAGGIAVKAEGNAVQSLANGGFVKAMAYVDFGTGLSGPTAILQCYNGLTGASSNGCGFSASWIKQGGAPFNDDNSISVIDFGFNVQDRFILANSRWGGGIDDEKVFYVRSAVGSQVAMQNWVKECPPAPSYCSVNAMSYYIIVY